MNFEKQTKNYATTKIIAEMVLTALLMVAIWILI